MSSTSTTEGIKTQTITDYHAKYFTYELTKRCPSDSLRKFTATISDAQVDLNPHQIDAALFAFRSPFSKGALLADEVGLGKTIEAGIVLSQKWAERKRRILIIVPSNLRKQWNQELMDKFFVPSIILETASFNLQIKKGNLNPFLQDEIIICSYQFARKIEVYIQQVNWDLIVIDEAHRLRNVYKKTNKIANSIKSSIKDYPKILLTATPLQNSLLELYGMVSTIDDYVFGDIESFKSQFSRLTGDDSFTDLKERLKPICKRTLRRQVLEYVKYTNRIAIVQEFYPTEEEERLYNLVTDYLQSPTLFALPSSQRKLMTLILRKLLASSTYAISGTLEALARRLEGIISTQEISNNLEENVSKDFETFDEIKDEWLEDEEEENEDEEKNKRQYTPEEINLIREEMERLKEFSSLAKSIKENSKGAVLMKALKRGFEEAEKLGAKRKALIFTESTRTQAYLKNILENTEFKDKIVLFNGSNNDIKSKEIYNKWLNQYKDTDRITGSKTADKRAAIIEYFEKEAEIMIATEAASEGVNLQFCSLVINYDLPWNPQRIEQRIGRCHRYGQKYDVVVVNFLNKKNAADQRVYQLLAEKFKLFSGVFGASDEVLGAVESGVDFEKRIAEIFQRCRTENEIQLAFDKLQNELEDQISEQMKDTRNKLLENFDEEVHEKLRINYQESKDYLTKFEYWLWQITKYFLKPYAEFDKNNDSFMLVKNPFPEEKIHSGPYRFGKNVTDVNTYRVGHPLAQRIINVLKNKTLDSKELIFDYSGSGKKITILEPLLGKYGWLTVSNLSINTIEPLDEIIFCGIDDQGNELNHEQCQRLFSLPASQQFADNSIGEKFKLKLNELYNKQETNMLSSNTDNSTKFFDEEIEKLDKWAEDIKNSLEIELKELNREIKTKKTEAKKIQNLDEKIKEQRKIKELEKKRNELRLNLFKAQDNVDEKKENLINTIEQKLKQQIEKTELFTIRWGLV